MSNWVGYAISVNCGEPLGCYQGTILEADGNTITLTKAFRNGFPYPKSQVTLNAADIKELKIIESRAEQSQQTHSTVELSKNKKVQRATVCENLQANPTSSGNQSAIATGSSGRPRTKPIDIQHARAPPAPAASSGHASSTPKARAHGDKARRRNEACFGHEAEPPFDDDFDFEGNLALFNKRELWERLGGAARPDVVPDATKLRHDQNVLGAPPAPRACHVPDAMRGARDYVTDAGLRVPSLTAAARRDLWAALRRAGLADTARALLARAAADLALRLVGGDRRLDARNAHQAPAVLALAGPGEAGRAALLAARLLAGHGARAAALLAGAAPPAAELRALAAAGVPLLEAPPAAAPDAVLLALHDPEGAGEGSGAGALLRWAGGARGALLALEPPAGGWAGVSCRATLQGALPGAPGGALGAVYLTDVGAPAGLFAELGVLYRSPFGACSVLALHPADD